MSNVDGLVRVLVCTISFGMGVDCVGVKTVIHLGPSKNVESYVQESGRCGRDGCQSNSIIYYVGRMLTHVDKHMKEYVKLQADGTKCRRKWLLSHFDIENSKNQKTSLHAVKHTCSDLCAKNCSCSACDCPVNAIPSTSAGTQNQCTRKRQISSEQLQQLTKQLIILRKELNLSIFEQFVGHTGQIHTPDVPIFFNQFGSFQINQVLHAAKHLFSIGDIICNVEIWKHDHAVKVYKVFYDVFKDVEPLSDNILTLQEDSYDNDSDELEWDDFMDDDNIPNISASIMDMSSFDFDMGNIDVEDDIIPPAIEDALQHVDNRYHTIDTHPAQNGPVTRFLQPISTSYKKSDPPFLPTQPYASPSLRPRFALASPTLRPRFALASLSRSQGFTLTYAHHHTRSASAQWRECGFHLT